MPRLPLTSLNDFMENFLGGRIIKSNEDFLSEWKADENQRNLQSFLDLNRVNYKKNKKFGDDPKKFSTPFMMFCKDKKGFFGQVYPNLTEKELKAFLSVKWKEIKDDPVIFEKYKKEAQEEQEHFVKEVKAYKIIKKKEEKIDKDAKIKARIQKIKERKMLKIFRPKSAYAFFKMDEKKILLEANPTMDKKEIHLHCQKKWREMKTAKSEIVEKYKKIEEEEKKKIVEAPLPVKKFKKYERKEKPKEKNKEKYNNKKGKNKKIPPNVVQLNVKIEKTPENTW